MQRGFDGGDHRGSHRKTRSAARPEGELTMLKTEAEKQVALKATL